MFALLAAGWLLGSLSLIAFVLLARRRRGALARQLHELRGALTAASLAVDLLPERGVGRLSARAAASDEIDRTRATLGELERLLHSGLVAPRSLREDKRPRGRACNQGSQLDAHRELSRLAMIWGEATRSERREFDFQWHGPTDSVFVPGPRRHLVEVVANLLENALRHGSGRISLMARVRCDSLRIEVLDQGPGLPRPFSTIIRCAPTGRHGHGLPNARRAAHALGGTLTSAPSGSGAKLAFTVPALHDPSIRASRIDEPSLVRG